MKIYSEKAQRSALSLVRREWKKIVKKAGLEGTLKAPIFELHRNRSWGTWDPQRRVLSLNARLAIDCELFEVVDTLRHEIAHQWVSEASGVAGEPPHGPTWRRGCRLFGADPRATASCQLESLTQGPGPAEKKIIDRVRKLLALAESDNVHEVELAALRASELMFKHQIESLRSSDRLFDYRTLGKPRKKRPSWYVIVSHILTEHFHVEAIWLRAEDKEWDADPQTPGFLLEVTGAPHSVEIAAYVHDFLLAEGQRLLQRYRARALDSSARSRRLFLQGLYHGFMDKLNHQRERMLEEHPDAAGRALVRQGDPALRAFHQSRYPRIKRSYGSASGFEGAAYNEGHSQGKALSLRPPVEGQSRGRLLE